MWERACLFFYIFSESVGVCDASLFVQSHERPIKSSALIIAWLHEWDYIFLQFNYISDV